jgi:hypothetical protein
VGFLEIFLDSCHTISKLANMTKEFKKIELRNLKLEDYLDLKQTMQIAYSDLDGQHWSQKAIEKLLTVFPEGQLCVEVDGKVVAAALAIIVDYEMFGDNHDYKTITGNYTFETHIAKGDVLYGIDVFVHQNTEECGLREDYTKHVKSYAKI